MATTQSERIFQLEVDGVGKDVLLCVSFAGHEAISRLFHFQLEVISEKPDQVKLDKLLGRDACLTMELPEGKKRYVHGVISAAAFVGREIAQDQRFSRYQLEVVPKFWLLSRTYNSRIFQGMTVPQIVEQVFSHAGFTDYSLALTGKYTPIDYCVQYRESDLNFVSRLLEREGICYFFVHKQSKHDMVLADSGQAFKDCEGQNSARFEPEIGYGEHEEVVTSWQESRDLRPGKIAMRDYNFQLPGKTLEVSTPTKIKAGNNDRLELYDFSGEYGYRFNKPDDRLDKVEPEGTKLIKLRMELEECQHETARGESNVRSWVPGFKFKVEGAPPGIAEGQYVLTSVEHAGRLGSYVSGASSAEYTNSFTCIPAKIPYRPALETPRPVVHGSQTAKIVGPAGEEIYTDKYGRVKVQFPWDREGKSDENSSCWIRVAQIHAGKNFGGIDIPRIGDEVIVSFMEGDPSQPIITGRVYHAENMPPFGLPDKKVVSGMKSKTYKGDGYNELVMDDSPGNELIRVHGQYDMDSTIEHDLREHVLNDRSRDVTNNETIQIGVDRSETVGSNESLTVGANKTIQIGSNHTETIGSNMTVTVGNNLTETVGINYAETVGAAMQLTVGAAMTQTIGAAYMLTVGAAVTQSFGSSLTTSIGSNRKEQVSGKVTEKVGGNVTQQVGGKHQEKVTSKYSLNAGSTITLKSDTDIVLTTGASSITLKKDGTIKIKGVKISVEGSAKITEKSAMISAEASAKHLVKGAMVNVEASAINTIKGALVKIN